MKWVLIGLLAVILPVQAETIVKKDGSVIDSEYAKVDKIIKKRIKTKCLKLAPMLYHGCATKVRRPFRLNGQIRGSEEYINKHFKDKSDKEITKAIELRKKQQKHAKDDDLYDEDEFALGEISQYWLNAEIDELRYLRDRDPSRHCFVSLKEREQALSENNRAPRCGK